MIVVGGGGAVFLLFLFVVLALVVLLPTLLLRSSRRAALTGPAWGPGPGWAPAQGWDVPQQPALPPVSPADVVSLRDRLGHDVRTLEPGDDPVSRQALADAAERHSTCSALLERAGSSQAQLRTAWLAAAEGLTAARLVRTRQGLDPGPEVPLPPTGPRLTAPTRVDVGGRTASGGPAYEPGRPHWFPGGAYGGRYVPGGWYDAPFWPSALVLGGLGGLAVGGLAGAMFADDLYDGPFDGGAYDGGVDGGVDGGGAYDGGAYDAGLDDGRLDPGFGGWGGGGEWGAGEDLGGGGDWGDGGDLGGGDGGDW